MDPIAFSIGSLEIRWYGIMMALSMLLGAFLADRLLRRAGRNGAVLWDGLFIIILAGVVGARLVYVLTNLSAYFGQGIPWWAPFAVWQGGLSFHGGMIGGVVATFLFFRKTGIPLLEVLDAFAVGISPGIILVRIGNYMNGDILGYKWEGPWAVDFPFDQYHLIDASAKVLRHPAEIYGLLVGVFCLLIAIILWNQTYLRKQLPHGMACFGFIAAYSLIRSVIEEPFRAVPLPWKLVDPATAGYGLLTSSQLASIFLILMAVVAFIVLPALENQRVGSESSGSPASGLSRQAKRAAKREQQKRS